MNATAVTTEDISVAAVSEKLSLREKIGYGLGDAGGTIIPCLIMN
ncbi:MFS/sugar transport family protein, partial [Cronobacter sakazakii]